MEKYLSLKFLERKGFKLFLFEKVNMVHKEINWTELKLDYSRWRSKLYKLTKELLTGSDRIELSNYNEKGYFHHVRNPEYFEQMKMFWEKERTIPEEWISKGNFFGIWTAMFNPHNTYSFAQLPIHIVRFYFKDGFFIYDKENKNHKGLSDSWNNKNRKNLWKTLRNENGDTLEERMKIHGYPSHKDFYEDNSFSAVVGYSDYISPVIVLGNAINKIEFLEEELTLKS
jgi:hypothetical protein